MPRVRLLAADQKGVLSARALEIDGEMARGQPTREGRSAQRRFTLLARVWMLALLAVVLVLHLAGQSAVALVVIAAGIAGFVIVFDARRPWWGPGIVDGRSAPANRRLTVALVVGLVLITVAIWTIFLASPR